MASYQTTPPAPIPRKKVGERIGELVVAQTHDLSSVRAILEHVGWSDQRLEECGCWLVARWRNEPVGVVGLETVVDDAVIGPLMVASASRGRGFGAALISAARKAASTRGARRLYALVPGRAADYLKRFGFIETTPEDFAKIVEGTAVMCSPQAQRGSGCVALCLDISHDGEISR
jgi:N-acetylglutamate synthase-like GNAT family acetyltransferase